MLIAIPNFLILFGQFHILNSGIGLSGSEPFNYYSTQDRMCVPKYKRLSLLISPDDSAIVVQRDLRKHMLYTISQTTYICTTTPAGSGVCANTLKSSLS